MAASQLWSLKNVSREQLWLMAADGVKKKEVAKTNFVGCVPATSPFGDKIGQTLWDNTFVKKRYRDDGEEREDLAKENESTISTEEELHVVVDMLAYQIDRGKEMPQLEWRAPEGKQ